MRYLKLFFAAASIFSGSLPCSAQTTPAVDDSSFSYYEVIEQRNFFRPKKEDAQTETTVTESAPAAEKPVMAFILTGVIEIKNGYKAIVEKSGSDKGFYVAQGDAIEDYTVKQIMLNKIILEKDSEQFELKLQQGSVQQDKQPADELQNSQDRIDRETGSEPANQTIRSNTMQQIRSGYRGTNEKL